MASDQTALKEQVRSRVNIVEVIGRYVKLQKSGRHYKGLCPFHHEDTPSFNVNHQDGLYHCFGCKAGGDVFTFVMQMEGLTFPEALAVLAKQAGVELPEAKNAVSGENALLYEVNKQAAEYYAGLLYGRSGAVAREYLKKRGINKASAELFSIGYASDTWRGLTDLMQKKDLLAVAVQAGLIMPKDDRHYDLLRNRIVFPVSDISSRIVAFGGRIIDNGQPKYLNSPETALFLKRRQLYGLNQARAEIRRTGRALVVEGFFDCVTLHQHGVTCAVATCGTALTPEHVQQIGRLARELFICYDADAAGKAGAHKGLAVVGETGLEVRVVELPAGDDPDSFVRKAGAEGFWQYLEKALPLRSYLLEEAMRACDLTTLSGRMQAVRAALPVLRGISGRVERDTYAQRLATRLHLPYESLLAELAEPGSHSAVNRHTNRGNRNTSRDLAWQPSATLPARPREVAEKELLRCLLQDRAGIGQVIAEFGEAPFTNATYNVVLRGLIDGKAIADVLPLLDEAGRTEVFEGIMDGGEITLTWQECLNKLRTEHMRDELAKMEEGLATLVDHNAEQFMHQWHACLLAFWRWRHAAGRG